MALLHIQPFLSPPSLSKPLRFSLINSIPKQTPPRRYKPYFPPLIQSKKQQFTRSRAVIGTERSVLEEDETVLLGQSSQEELRGARVVVDYDWTEEWYPLYLTQDLPDDAPLGLTVFDKQIVLYRDGNGELHCYQDRCPHRYPSWK